MLSSGFTNAPVSKALLFGLIASSILAGVTDTKHLFYINVVPHLWPYRQIWRLLFWQTCYINSSELLFATITLYHVRIIERLWGPRKFGSFITTLFPLTAFFPPFLLAIFIRPLSLNTINYLPAGPTALIFALLAQYHAAIPHVYKYKIVTSTSASGSPSSSSSSSSSSANNTPDGLTFSDKTMTYVLASQLALSQLPGSLISAAVGWGLGVAWRRDLLPQRVMSWRLPAWMVGEERRANTGFEGLRQRLEGEGRASGVDGGADAGNAGRQRRGMGAAMLDQFRGSF